LESKQEQGFYVLGDNRAHSLDSRMFGLINPEAIEGKGAYLLYPFQRFGFVP
jgi:signal peptidase I